MNITLFGSTGTVGQLVTKQALEQGHTITAFARNPDKLNQSHERLIPFQGDILDPDAVQQASKNQDAIICTLGMPLLNKDKLRSKGTKNIVHAMKTFGVSRLICLSSMGAGDSRQLLPLKYKYLIAPLLMRRVLADHTEQEQCIQQSNLDWTIVRPGNFTKGKHTGNYRHGFSNRDNTSAAKVSRPDVAEFILNQLTNNTYLNQAPCISY